jgi:serine/threonine protein kinase
VSQPVPFGKYYLLERINVGGMAEVFKAKAFGVEGFERLVAVKRILPNIAEDEEFITMFIDEAKIAVQLQHANIAQIFDLGKVEDSYFIALEYVHGKDLRAMFDHFRKVGERMPAPQVCFVMMQVCEGLDYAHNKRDPQGRELGLVHRDVSPQNVLVGYEGEIKLIDFGIAKAAGKASKTQAGILKGKFGYMSPEQVRGLPVDRRSDVFAAGICLYELLTGERLFIGESDFSTLEKVRNVEILPPSSFNKRIAPELERIVLKALAKDAEDRYQNAIDLHDDLQAYLYSTGEFFSRKDLAGWMKKTFASEIAEESARNAQWEQLEQPTPVPYHAPQGESRKTSGSGKAVRGQGLDWDEEELETQIYDRVPGGSDDDATESPRASARGHGRDRDDDEVEERPSELSSSDIMLPDSHSDVQSIDNVQDDKTAIAPPPDEAQLAYDPDYPGAGGYPGLPPSMLGAPMPARPAPAPFGQTLLGATAPLPPMAGPPPGLSAYRQTGSMPVQNPGGWAPQPAPPQGANGGGYQPAGSPFRQTIMGIPQMPAPYQPPAPPPPTGYAEAARSLPNERRRFPLLATVLVLLAALGGLMAYVSMNKPGRLSIEVTPTGATVQLDGTTLKGIPPFTLEKPPGTYKLVVTQDGYTREERRIELEAGGKGQYKVDLRPSPDTGFELTSDPPGQLVWMDGNPFTGTEPNGPQARTDFKATRVPPGRHALEIKGDPRFRPWRHEFYQEPGKLIPIRATLVADAAAGKVAALQLAKPIPIEGVKAPEMPKAGGTPEPAVKSTPAPAPPVPTQAKQTQQAATTPAAPPKPTPPAPTPPAPTPPKPTTPASSTASTSPASTPAATPPKRVTTGEPGTEPAPAVAKPATCTVTIGSKPWAEVWIDGKNTQKLTPLVDYKLPCGKHKLTLKNPELSVTKDESLTVKAGEKWKKIFQLLDEE